MQRLCENCGAPHLRIRFCSQKCYGDYRRAHTVHKMPSGDRKCFRCGIVKPLSEFYRCSVRYFQRECIPCCKDRRSRWWKSARGKQSARVTKLKSRFGITPAEYDLLLKEQGGKCKICGAISSVNGHRLAIDHDHTTGKIRGLLCKACNAAIGYLGDNPVLAEKAAIYLREYEKTQGASAPGNIGH